MQLPPCHYFKMPQEKKSSAHPKNVRLESVGRAYAFMEYYFRTAVVINAVPFTYNPRTRRFSVRKTSIKHILWVITMPIGIFVETAQVTWELVVAKDDGAVSRGECALIAFIFSSWSLILSVHYNVLRRHKEMMNHMNQTIALREWFTETHLPPCEDHKIVRAYIITSCMQCFFQCLMVASEGTKAHFLYSNVPPEYRTPRTGAAWSLYAYYRVTSNFLSGYFHVFAGALHVQTCNQVLALRYDILFEINLAHYGAKFNLHGILPFSGWLVGRTLGRICNTIAWSKSYAAGIARHILEVSSPK